MSGIVLTSSDRARFWTHVERHGDDCWLWTGSCVRGYGQFSTSDAGKQATHRAHRILYLLEHGFIPDRLLICHHCDNRRCVNPAHLFTGTTGDNMRDASGKGRLGHPSLRTRRLSDAHVREIRTLRPTGVKIRELAEWYHVSVPTIWNVLSKKQRFAEVM